MRISDWSSDGALPISLTLPLVTLTVPVLYQGIGESPERRIDGIGRSRRQTRSHDAGHERRHREFGRPVGRSTEKGRSEERRVGKESGRAGRSRGSLEHLKKIIHRRSYSRDKR